MEDSEVEASGLREEEKKGALTASLCPRALPPSDVEAEIPC